MKVLRTIDEVRRWRGSLSQGTTVAFVPTMGFLHQGHLALMQKGRKLCDRLVVSIFVNPIQFGPTEDLDRYPRDEKRDCELAEQVGVDLLFLPRADAMYGENFQTSISVDRLSMDFCGACRPGHFSGVATVVAKLFNIVSPTIAVFGEKDFQQLAVVRQMARDLDFPVDVIGHAIVREDDGLAMSSRNVYLDEQARKDALFLYQSICRARQMAAGAIEMSCEPIVREIVERAARHPRVELEYAAIVNALTLVPQETVDSRSVLLLACRVGPVRLIDNVFLREDHDRTDM